MGPYRESVTVEDVATGSLQVIIDPRDLGERPNVVLSFANAAGGAALADAEIEFGPSESGPWFAEDLSGTAIPTLAAGSDAVYRVTRYDRFARVRAQAAGADCDLTVYLDAEPT